MGFINNCLGGEINYGEFIRLYGKYADVNPFVVMFDGADPDIFPNFTRDVFNTSEFNNYKDAIDKGYFVLTTLPTGEDGVVHGVAIIGYHPDGSLIYMDPQTGSRRECPANYPLPVMNLVITGNK